MKIERVHHLKYDSKYEDVKLHETTRNYQSGGFCRPKVGCYPWVCLAVEPIANKDHDKQQTEGTDWASININNAVLEPKNRSIYISNSLDHRNTLGFGNVFGIIWPSKTGISYDIARNHSCSTNVVFFFRDTWGLSAKLDVIWPQEMKRPDSYSTWQQRQSTR